MPWNYWVSALAGVAITALLFTAMYRSWSARSQRAATITLGEEVGDIIASFPKVSYVATTENASPPSRVNVPGLSFTGFATVAVHSLGVSVQVRGESVRTIPVAKITGVETARSQVNRAVEADGLAILDWEWEGKSLATGLRFPSFAQQEQFLDAVTQLRRLDHSHQKENA